jgi:ATP-dependent Clp protease ATP-binding subunit ClpC
VFERFSDGARKVIVKAQEEARLLDHNYIGTEHLLLGLIAVSEGVAARALTPLGVTLESTRRRVGEIIGRGETPAAGHIPFTPRSKKVLELALREALQLGHNYIGTEHLLLGIVRDGEGVAAQILRKSVGDLDRVRSAVIAGLSKEGGGAVSPTSEASGSISPRCPSCSESLGDESVGVRRIRASAEDAEEGFDVLLAYCRSCGCPIGTVAP